MLLTKVVFRFSIYFFTEMLILALCSFLPIISHLISIFTFPLSRFIPRATRGPLLDPSLCTILEITPLFKPFSETREILEAPPALWVFTSFIQGS